MVWYSEDDHLKTEDFCGTLPPDMKEYESPCPGKPLVSFLKGMDYSLNSLVGKKTTFGKIGSYILGYLLAIWAKWVLNKVLNFYEGDKRLLITRK